MSRLSTPGVKRRITYPTSDGKPMAETDTHRDLMTALIETLKAFYAAEPLVYVSGNLLLCYEEGNRRRHVSPDVFVVRGVRSTNARTTCCGRRDVARMALPSVSADCLVVYDIRSALATRPDRAADRVRLMRPANTAESRTAPPTTLLRAHPPRPSVVMPSSPPNSTLPNGASWPASSVLQLRSFHRSRTCQTCIGLGPSLHLAWLIAIRSVAHTMLGDRL